MRKIGSERRINTLVLVILSLYFSLFANAQESVDSVTNSPAADLSRRSQTEAETVVLPKSVPDRSNRSIG